MRILFFTQFFRPDIQATSRICSELCDDLSSRHEITVICGRPLVLAPDRTGAGQVENRNPRTRRVFSTTFIRKSMFDRVLNHATFILSGVIGILGLILQGKRYDALMFTSDNPLNFFAAAFFKGIPKIYLCKDLYLEQAEASGIFKKGIFSILLKHSQSVSFAVSDKIVVIGEMMRSYLTGRLGIRNDKVIVIHDWADTDCIIPVPQANEFSIEKGLAGKFVVMHSGRVGLLQDLELLLECARDMRDIPDLRFVIAGEGVNRERLMKTASEMGLKNVLFIPFQPEETLKYSLGSASVGIILFKDDYSHCLVPSRLYCHLASQRPIIATASDSSDLKVMIDRANAGIVIPPGRKDALKNAIEELYRNRERLAALGRNARDFVIKNYSRSRMTEKYMDMLLEIEKYGRQNIRQGT